MHNAGSIFSCSAICQKSGKWYKGVIVNCLRIVETQPRADPYS